MSRNITHSIQYIVLLICLLLMQVMPFNMYAQKRDTQQFTLILDPGHGGKDGGTHGYGLLEKNVVLSVAKKVADLVRAQHPNVRVVLTRSTDVFIGLQERCNIANRNNGNLFISIHCNNAPSKSVRGSETYVLGLAKFNQNLGVAMKENEALLLEDNYKTTYRGFDPSSSESYIMFSMIQNRYLDQSIYLAEGIENNFKRKRPSRGVRQNVFWVQVYSAMPSVLTELGFLSHKDEAAYLGSESGQNETARDIANAFSRYYSRFTSGKKTQYQPPIETTEETQEMPDKEVEESNNDSAPIANTVASDNSYEVSAPETSIPIIDTRQRNETRTKPTEPKAEKGTYYRVQVLASKKKIATNDRELKKAVQPIVIEKGGSIYKYMAGKVNTLNEARALCRKLKKNYSGAYIVKYKNNKRAQEIYL